MSRLFPTPPRRTSLDLNLFTRFISTTPPPPRRQNRLPASYYRGGTSRALIFQQEHLPSSRADWAPIFRGILGSPDSNGRQLDGIGGGISSLSKICVVGGPSTRDDADVDYTFAAVGVEDGEVDFSSNCGNMLGAIGGFAVDSGLIEVEGEGEGYDGVERMVSVRIHNTNTGKIIQATFPVVDGEAASSGEFAIDGVEGTAARVELAFLDPGGSKTGKLLPTGNITDRFDGVETTCIDVGNPCVFLNAESLCVEGTILPDEIDAHPTLASRLESIRQQASVAMGLSTTLASAAGSIPKIALISPPKSHTLLSGKLASGKDVDLVVRAMSMGQPHRAIPITVALAVAAAANLKGSIVEACLNGERVDGEGVTLGHPTGKIVVGARFQGDGELVEAVVYRTARRIMEGIIYWK